MNKEASITYFENLFFLLNDQTIDYTNDQQIINLFNLIQQNFKNNFNYGNKKNYLSLYTYNTLNYFSDKVKPELLQNYLFSFIIEQPLIDTSQINILNTLKKDINTIKWNKFILSFLQQNRTFLHNTKSILKDSVDNFFFTEINEIINNNINNNSFNLTTDHLFNILNYSIANDSFIINEDHFVKLLLKNDTLLNSINNKTYSSNYSFLSFINGLYTFNKISENNKKLIFDIANIDDNYFYNNSTSILHIINNSDYDSEKTKNFLNKIQFTSTSPIKNDFYNEFVIVNKQELFKSIICSTLKKSNILYKCFSLMKNNFNKGVVIINFFLDVPEIRNSINPKNNPKINGVDLLFQSLKGKQLLGYKEEYPEIFIQYEKYKINNIISSNNTINDLKLSINKI